jgi:hypothetical protein
MAGAVSRRRRAVLGSRDARKEHYIRNDYDREHDRYSCENQSSFPNDFRRSNFPDPLGLPVGTGKKERNGLVRRETIYRHWLMPQARAKSLGRGGGPFNLMAVDN